MSYDRPPTGNAAWDAEDRSETFGRAEITRMLDTPGLQMPFRGWFIRWMGWRQPVNQVIEFGVWVAVKHERSGLLYSTTLGYCGHLPNPDDPMNLNAASGEQPMLVHAFGRQDAATRALTRLLNEIKRLG